MLAKSSGQMFFSKCLKTIVLKDTNINCKKLQILIQKEKSFENSKTNFFFLYTKIYKSKQKYKNKNKQTKKKKKTKKRKKIVNKLKHRNEKL